MSSLCYVHATAFLPKVLAPYLHICTHMPACRFSTFLYSVHHPLSPIRLELNVQNPSYLSYDFLNKKVSGGAASSLTQALQEEAIQVTQRRQERQEEDREFRAYMAEVGVKDQYLDKGIFRRKKIRVTQSGSGGGGGQINGSNRETLAVENAGMGRSSDAGNGDGDGGNTSGEELDLDGSSKRGEKRAGAGHSSSSAYSKRVKHISRSHSTLTEAGMYTIDNLYQGWMRWWWTFRRQVRGFLARGGRVGDTPTSMYRVNGSSYVAVPGLHRSERDIEEGRGGGGGSESDGDKDLLMPRSSRTRLGEYPSSKKVNIV